MAKKIAVVISGAVSLGSYEAGVMYEVINALAYHNSKAPDEASQFKIDVIVGTSAGAMTAAVLANQLLFAPQGLSQKETNALYQVWVKRTRIEDLLKDGPGDAPDKSILSSATIRALGAEFLPDPSPTPVTPHIAADSNIQLGMAMANLNGIDYGIKTLSKHDFTYTHFEDQLIRNIDGQNPTGANWEEIRKTAIASGAFPFAFAVSAILREKADYDPVNLETPFSADDTATFTYCDGGMFDNEPLGMAKGLVDGIDNHNNEDNRFYFFVCPHSRKGDSTPLAKYNADSATMGITGLRIVNAIMANAAFQDWVDSEQVNQDIKLLDLRAAQLAALVAGGLDLVPSAALVQELVDKFIPDKTEQAATIELLGKQYAVECASIAKSGMQNQETIFLQQILILQKAADLMEKDLMYVIDITANETEELGGSGFHSFVGFCSETIREHDFQVGRAKALAFIANNTIGLDKSYTPADGTPPPTKPVPGISVAPRDVRQQFYDRLTQRVGIVIKESSAPWYLKLLGGAIASVIVDALGVKKALDL